MKQSNYQVRQGDVLLMRVDALPDGEPEMPRRPHVILAEGEQTGHCHYLTSEEAIQFSPTDRLRRIAEEWGITDTRSILSGLRVTTEGATLYHGTPTLDPAGPRDADHDPIALPIGDYLVVCPREYDGSEDFKRVVD